MTRKASIVRLYTLQGKAYLFDSGWSIAGMISDPLCDILDIGNGRGNDNKPN